MRSRLVAASAFTFLLFLATLLTPNTTKAAEAFKFNWPIPGRVQVTDTALKKGKTAKTRYVLKISRMPNGGAKIGFTDFEFLELEGFDIESAVMRKVLAPALAITKLIPSFKIDRAGNLIEVMGMEAVIEELLQLEEDEAVRAQLTKALKAPELAATMEAAAASYWQQWVGYWIGLDLARGEARDGEQESTFLGVTVAQSVTIKNLGESLNYPGKTHLKLDGVIGGEALLKAAIAALREFETTAGRNPDEVPVDLVDQGEKSLIVELVTDVQTLMPVYVKTEEIVKLKLKGEEVGTQIERHKYKFDWSF
jgi:hypothetical protein